MGNLFNSIDTKVCRKCGHEKPLLAFQKKGQKDGVAIRECYCKECFGAIRWARMSDEAREAKRARDRDNIKNNIGKERIKRANDSRLKRARIAAVMDNVGAFCVVQWHKCVKCGRQQYLKNKEISGDKCVRCSRSVFASGPIPVRSAVCPKCGIIHIAKNKVAMCSGCSDAARKENMVNWSSHGNMSRRVRRSGVHKETVNRLSVYDRDRYRCYQCGVKVKVSATYMPNQATLDHVIPLSAGGSHTYDNLRTCCQSCNSKKTNKVAQGTQIGMFCCVKERGGGTRKEGCNVFRKKTP